MTTKISRVDSQVKKDIKEIQQQVAKEKGKWIGEAKALNILLGREKP